MAEGLMIITGGLGFVGQSLAAHLTQLDRPVVIVDRSRRASQVPVPVVHGDIRHAETWHSFRGRAIGAVFHCAGRIQVAESMTVPWAYFDDNVAAGLAMMDHLTALGSPPVIFSSSAAVYGTPERVPIVEQELLAPVNPYGVTKRQFEEVLSALWESHGVRYMALRYFNAAGAQYQIAEAHWPETHLLPLTIDRVRQGLAPIIYGDRYATRDGTALRDYVHMKDLLVAHVSALDYLEQGGKPTILNIGSGTGATVQEVVAAVRSLRPDAPQPEFHPARLGDPAALVADIGKAHRLIGWEPQHSTIEEIVRDAWDVRR